MYEATAKERRYMKEHFGYTSCGMDNLEVSSDQVRKGEPIDFALAPEVCAFQERLKEAREMTRPWWKFW